MPRIALARSSTTLRAACLCCALVSCLASSGCVRRRMTVRSNPPGAMVWIDNQPIGMTPVSTSFVYYGTRKIQLVKDGYETMTVYRKIRSPWYQIPPLDLASEHLWPKELRDERVLDFELRVQPPVSLSDTYQQAEEFRRAVRQDAGVTWLQSQREGENKIDALSAWRDEPDMRR